MNGKHHQPSISKHEDLMEKPAGVSSSSQTWSQYMRELRHSQCLMTPVSLFCILSFAFLSLLGLILQFPGLLIGLLLSQLMKRGNWFVEFLYPTAIARWGHLLLLRWGAASKMSGNNAKSNNNKNSKGATGIKSLGLHSRAIEQRTEVIKGRVYIHPLPQFMDNIGYLLVCLPEETSNAPMVGMLVDCGDAVSISKQLEFIQDTHYSHLNNNNIEVHSILSTHKHHDHTAGNKAFKSRHTSLQYIFGGAVDRVPQCNQFVRNGTIIPLPKVDGNNMNELVEIECVAVPAHTRGSILYALRPKTEPGNSPVSYLFTGDTLFSAGGGMPFEADIVLPSEKNVSKKKITSPINPTSGHIVMERCFAEILVRSHTLADHFNPKIAANQVLLFPGHEYTHELIARQLEINSENSKEWNKTVPSDFFEVVSHYFISNHKRTLPKNSRLLTVPSPLSRELKINPLFRKLRKRGEHILLAVKIWHKYFADEDESMHHLSTSTSQISKSLLNGKHTRSSISHKSPTTEECWNLDYTDANRPVFTTVYATDLDRIIYGLKNGTITSSKAAKRLQKMKSKLDKPVVFRRPIPGTLPSEKSMYLGMLALAMLGSPPSALTISDSKIMNLAEPIENSDHLLISKSRLINVLRMLGLLPFNDIEMLHKINFLWETAYMDSNSDLVLEESQTKSSREVGESDAIQKISNYKSIDAESNKKDELELGILKLTLYALPFNQRSWFSKLCLPCCSSKQNEISSKVAKGKTIPKKRVNAELVKHDPYSCPMCEGVVGCRCETSEEEESDTDISIMSSHQEFTAVVGTKRIVVPLPKTHVPLKERIIVPNSAPASQFQESVEMEVSKYYQN